MAKQDINVGVTGFSPADQHLISGGELLRQNRVAEARAEFDAALEIDPDNIKALGLLGLACFRMDDFESALPVYRKLVSLNPMDASFSLNLGLVHLKLGDALAAIEELSRSRDLDPSQGRSLSYLGLAYARNGQYQEAYQAFLQARQDELALQMEQYLSEDQRRAIQAAVSRDESRPEKPATPPVPPTAGQTDSQPPTAEAEPAAHTDSVKDPTPMAPPRPTPMAPPRPTPASSATASPAAEDEPAPEPEATERSETEINLDYDDVELIPADDDESTGGSDPEFAIAEDHGFAGPAAESAGDDAGAQPDAPDATPAGAEPGHPVHSIDDGRPGVISQAVERATPSAAATAGAARVAAGHIPPQSLTEFATSRLIRPEDGDHTFETSAGGVLIIRVRGRVYARTEGVEVTGGELAYEVASRHSRGTSTRQAFSSDGRQMFIVSGHGHLIAAPLGQHFSAVSLDEDILYLREDLVFAFEESLRWENGNVPGSRATINMVQFRGEGAVAFRTPKPLLAVKLAPERVLYVDAEVLAGWIGRVIPRAVSPAAGGDRSTLFVECSGEGVVLVEEDDESPADLPTSAKPGGDGRAADRPEQRDEPSDRDPDDA